MIAVRSVDLPDRIELHAETCKHRIPVSRAIVNQHIATAEYLRSLYDDCVRDGCQQVVMPCLRKVMAPA
jgi:hypothetical protein